MTSCLRIDLGRFALSLLQMVFVQVTAPGLFYTLDGGATFIQVTFSVTDLVTTTVVYHPTRDGWMLMKSQYDTASPLLSDYAYVNILYHICTKAEITHFIVLEQFQVLYIL